MTEQTTLGDRLRTFAGELVGHAFVADIHNLDGRGPREVQKLADLFEEKILDFMIREKHRNGELTAETKK